MARVERHYSRLVDYPLAVSIASTDHSCVAIAGDAAARCRWPHFADGEQFAIATAYVPAGWSRLVSGEHDRAPLALAQAVADDPAAAIAALSPPLAVAALDRRSGGLVVINDALGAARAFTLTTDGLTIWSNRPGALAVFAGIQPAADPEGWRVLAGAGWPLGGSSPIAGVKRLGPGTVCRADAAGAVTFEASHAVRSLVAPNSSWRELAGPAAEQMVSQAAEVASLWPEQADVDLSGRNGLAGDRGRHDRGGDRCEVSDLERDARRGEGRPRANGAPRGRAGASDPAAQGGQRHPGTPLLERAANLHPLHDGVRPPQKLRGKMTLPRPRPEGAKFSCDGGEIAHGFFDKSPAEIRGLRFGPGAPAESGSTRFFASGPRRPTPGRTPRWAARERRSSRSSTRARGTACAVCPDWFYLVDRFAHRSGLATDSERFCCSPFRCSSRPRSPCRPRQRVEGRLHEHLTARLGAGMEGVEYFQETEGEDRALEARARVGGRGRRDGGREHPGRWVARGRSGSRRRAARMAGAAGRRGQPQGDLPHRGGSRRASCRRAPPRSRARSRGRGRCPGWRCAARGSSGRSG